MFLFAGEQVPEQTESMNQSALLVPNGKLADGTMLFGPMISAPKGCPVATTVSIDGAVWHIGASRALAAAQFPELEAWVRKTLSARAKATVKKKARQARK